MDELGWENAVKGVDVVDNMEDGVCKSICKRFTKAGDSANCELAICFKTDECVTAPQSEFVKIYNDVLKKWCEPKKLGGKYTASQTVEYWAVVNPDYQPPATGDKRDVLGRGIDQNNLSPGLYEELVNATAHQTEEAHDRNAKREDDKWVTVSISRNVAKDGDREKASTILDSGTTQTWSFSGTKTRSTSTSAEGGFAWAVFSLSAGVTTEESYSTSIESGMQFTKGDCPQNAVVYFVPLWTHYYGFWESDESTLIDIWIPESAGSFKDGTDKTAGKFETQCIG